MKLEISIVNFNAGNFLIECLESIKKIEDEAEIEVFVVDNASIDDSIQKAQKKFPKVNYILNSQNLGFGKAQNQVLKNLDTEYVLILNPDTKILAGTIKFMLQFMEENNNVGAATCRVEKIDGSLDLASHRGFPTPWASFKYFFLRDDSLYHLTNRDMKKPHEVDSIVGAFFLTRKSVLEKVGLFDEDYFLFADDIDLCFRIKKAGFKIMYVPSVKVIHLKGISSGIKKHSNNLSSATVELKKKSLDHFYNTMKIFYRKNLAKNYPFFINWLVYLGINIKWGLAKRKLVV